MRPPEPAASTGDDHDFIFETHRLIHGATPAGQGMMRPSVRHGAAGHNEYGRAEWWVIRQGDDDEQRAPWRGGLSAHHTPSLKHCAFRNTPPCAMVIPGDHGTPGNA